MAQLTDAQYKLLAQDAMTAEVAFQTAKTNRDAARKALAAAIASDRGPGGSIVILGRSVTVNADGDDITVSPQRVVV